MQYRKHDLHSLDPNKRALVPHSIAREPIAQLIHAIGGPHHHQEGSEREAGEEGPEAPGQRPAVPGADVADEVVREEDQEHGEGEELERQPEQRQAQDDLARVPLGTGRHPRPHGLERDGEQVARDEDPVYGARREPGEAGRQVRDRVGEGHVDRCAVPDWGDAYADFWGRSCYVSEREKGRRR